MSTEVLKTADARPGVRVLTLNRPERRNALSPELVDALLLALKDAERDAAVQVVVLTGAGDKAFCAGGDLGAPAGEGFLGMHDDRGRFVELLTTLRFSRKPTIAAVNGMALGGGFGLVLACDFALAAQDAELGTPEVKRGLFPMMIGRLVYEVLPLRIANELVLLGEKLSAARAKELFVVNDVVASAQLLDATLALADRLVALSPAVLSLGRRAMMRQRDMTWEPALGFLRDQLTLNLQTEDAAEGVSAFLGKRDPQWKGR